MQYLGRVQFENDKNKMLLWGKNHGEKTIVFKKKNAIHMNESPLKIKLGICVSSLVPFLFSYESDRHINVLMSTLPQFIYTSML